MEQLAVILGNILQIAYIGMFILYMFCLPKAIHIFQQESYQFRDYYRWIAKNPKQAFGNGIDKLAYIFIYFVAMILLGYVMNVLKVDIYSRQIIYEVACFTMLVLFYIVTIELIIKWKKERKKAKKKFVVTGRVKRLMFFAFIATLLVYATMIPTDIPVYTIETNYFWVAQGIINFCILIITMPIIVILANYIAWPTETLINQFYINSATWKLEILPKYRKLIKIGITGSYGKTSTKFILKTILGEKYNVLATPESYNTTMGNIKIIRKELKPEHEVFISEMGARYNGDIKKICDIVHPQIGLITSIGEQHLESFKSIENIAKTKAELISSIPNDGAIFLPNDERFCKKIYEEKDIKNKFLYAIDDKKSSVYAKNIKMGKDGCEFVAVTSIGEIKCVSKLLGEHNIQNILGAISIAVYLGLSKDEIARGVKKIEAIEHRLQIIPNDNGTIVIDDAFNSNPVGSKMALDVLKSFDGRKIVITPGMVELGEKEAKYNKEFGMHMASCADIAILVGVKRSKPIEEGLLKEGFDRMNIFVVPNLNEATKKLGQIVKSGDVVLFENDLPDNYNE